MMPVDEKTRDTLKDALNIGSLSLPPSPPVIDIKAAEYTDTSGDEALRVWVTIAEDTDENNFSGEAIIKLKSAIQESLIAHGIHVFPYVFLVKPSDRLP
jgi:hypothetical protein